MIALLSRKEGCTLEELRHCLKDSQATRNNVSVHLCELRKVLARAGKEVIRLPETRYWIKPSS